VIYFISDLHLSPETPGVLGIFERFVKRIASPENHLFILGDFFEAWVGDDHIADPFNQKVVGALRKARQQGLEISLMHGNRDFMIGDQFAMATGCRLLADPYVLSTPEWQFVLSHGDALCTDDAAYQVFRKQVRDTTWQTAFLAKPLTERIHTASQMRAQSKLNQQNSAYVIADLNITETEDFLRTHGYATFIHGHTHRPAKHDHVVDGIHVERWVLADWHEQIGEALTWDGEQLSRLTLQ
jgi:UDP-2,3-diacylglucosamine hydrolase